MSSPLTHLLNALAWTPIARAVVTHDAAASAVDALPFATHEAVVTLPGLGTLRCYQLSTGERVFDAADVERLFNEGLES